MLAAYVNHGAYNVFMVDWGILCRPPCYVAAVHNLKPVAKCLAYSFSFLRNSGMPVQRTTCVGHSLGKIHFILLFFSVYVQYIRANIHIRLSFDIIRCTYMRLDG